MADLSELRKVLREELKELYDKLEIIKSVPLKELHMSAQEDKLKEVTELIGDVSYSNYKMFMYKMDLKIEGKQYLTENVVKLLDEYGKQTYNILLSLRDISANLRFLLGRQ